tara:strand:+ start:1056 stop:2504 length:1449 start_codon:yes stop_codon:yes gene_type:complete
MANFLPNNNAGLLQPPVNAQPQGLFAKPRTTYESLERFIPPELRGLIPSWPKAFQSPEKTALLGAQTLGPQADLAAGLTSWNNAWRGLLDSEQPLSKRLQDFGVGSAYTAAALPMMAFPGTIAWHGTPHRWAAEPGYPHGRPRLDKMGTGEGAQAYGRGFYSAKAEKVGREYADALAQRKLLVDGEVDDSQILRTAITSSGSPEAHIRRIKKGLVNKRQKLEEADRTDLGGFSEYSLYKHEIDYLENNIKTLEPYIGKKIGFGQSSNLYKLDIPDADTAKFLDYDAPLDAQPQVVKDALKKEGLWPDGDTDRIRGGDIFHNMKAQLGEDGATAALRDADVPGLRFQDQLSRGKAVDYPGTMNAVRIGSKTAEDYGVGYWEELRNLVSKSRHSLEESQGRILKVIRERRKGWDDLSTDPSYQYQDYAKDQAKKWRSMEIDAQSKGVAYGDPSITHNYVTWDQDVLNRTKMLEIDDQPVGLLGN